MNIYSDTTENKLKNTCVTIGTFDGVHKGHRDILSVLKNIARKNDLNSTVVTFYPHPRTVISENYDMSILTTKEEKIELLQQLDIDNLYIINFTKEFAGQTSEEFVKNYIVEKFDAKHVVIGHDHKFGKDRSGDENKLKELGEKFNFNVTAVKPVYEDGELISSTKIRNALNDGDVEKAAKFLGRNYSLAGKVVEGAKRGRILGFPTANLDIDNSMKLIPLSGVYAVKCSLEGEELNGVMNIGYRPTFEDDNQLVVEVNIFNFNRDIYGKKLKIDFIKRIRPERKFSSKEELISQIENDKAEAAKVLEVYAN